MKAKSENLWYGVRCVFALDGGDASHSYEERITIWMATSLENAITRAENEAAEYARDLSLRYLGFAQAFAIDGEPAAGTEVFSLVRDSDLGPSEYLNHHFDTGRERQGSIAPHA